MAKALRRIPFDEFAANLPAVFDRIVAENEAVVVEKGRGMRAVLKPLPTRRAPRRRRVVTDADHEAFLSSAGGWKDVDTEKLKRDIYESRRISTRPRIDL